MSYLPRKAADVIVPDADLGDLIEVYLLASDCEPLRTRGLRLSRWLLVLPSSHQAQRRQRLFPRRTNTPSAHWACCCWAVHGGRAVAPDRPQPSPCL